MSRKITEDQARKSYEILVTLGKAKPDDVHVFVLAVSDDPYPAMEYRFIGNLGFGGKFRNNGNNGDIPHVDCYPEDFTEERARIIGAINAELRKIFDDG